jgi:hypothetical protein
MVGSTRPTVLPASPAAWPTPERSLKLIMKDGQIYKNDL